MPDARDCADGGPGRDAAPSSDLLGTESGWLRWRERWRASSPPARLLSVAAIALALAAVVIADVAVHTHPVRRASTVLEPLKPGPVTVDSSGCPVRVRCTAVVQNSAKAPVALFRAFPGADVTSSVLIRDAGSGRTYKRLLLAHSGPTNVIVTAQCIPGAGSSPDRVERGPITRSGGSAVRTTEVVVAGRGGCSVSVAANLHGDGTKPERAMVALAHDPALQLTP